MLIQYSINPSFLPRTGRRTLDVQDRCNARVWADILLPDVREQQAVKLVAARDTSDRKRAEVFLISPRLLSAVYTRLFVFLVQR